MHARVEVIVDYHPVEAVSQQDLRKGFFNSHVDIFRRVRSPLYQSCLQRFHRRRHDEDGKGAVAEDLLQIDAAFYVDVKKGYHALFCDSVDLFLQRAVIMILIHLLPLDKLPGFDLSFELSGPDEIVFPPVHFVTSWFPAGGRDGERQGETCI